MLAEENAPEAMIRLFIRGMGWGGPSFGMSLDETKEDHDSVLAVDDFRFVLDQKVAGQLKNAIVDYKKSFFGEGFSITAGKP